MAELSIDETVTWAAGPGVAAQNHLMPRYKPDPREHTLKPISDRWLFSEKQQLVCHFKPNTPSVHAQRVQCPAIHGFHHAHRCRRPAGGCSGITPLRHGRQCSRSAGSDALHRCGEQKCCYRRGMVQTNRHEHDGQSTGSGEARGIHCTGKASATWLESSESKLELSMGWVGSCSSERQETSCGWGERSNGGPSRSQRSGCLSQEQAAQAGSGDQLLEVRPSRGRGALPSGDPGFGAAEPLKLRLSLDSCGSTRLTTINQIRFSNTRKKRLIARSMMNYTQQKA